MPLRSKVIKLLDKTFNEVEPSGKAVVLALEIERLMVVTQQFYDDVRRLVERAGDEDFELEDARIGIFAISRSLAAMNGQPDK